MKTKLLLLLFVLVLISAEWLAGQEPQKPTARSLPTEIYRAYPQGGEHKFQVEYDANGNVISSGTYYKADDYYDDYFEEGDDCFAPGYDHYPWLLDILTTYSYTKLPNGLFRQSGRTDEEFPTKAILGGFPGQGGEYSLFRNSAAYDAKGMELWNQQEHSLRNGDLGELTHRQEAVMKDGVRVGLRNYDAFTQQWETDSRYTFDTQGRVIKYEEDGSGEEYTWSPEGKLISYKEYEEDAITEYTNIVAVANEQYINVYDLHPLQAPGFSNTGQIHAGSPMMANPFFGGDWNNFLFSADVLETYQDEGGEYREKYTKKATINADGTERRTWEDHQGILMYDMVTSIDEGGNITRITIDRDEQGNLCYEDTLKVEYNTYGDIVRIYEKESGYEGEEELEMLFNRTYRPDSASPNWYLTQTVFLLDGIEQYTENYTGWVWQTITGIDEVKQKEFQVYPNPTTDKVYIQSADNRVPIVNVYNLQGRHLLKIQSNEIDLSAYPQGIYLLQIDRKMTKVIKLP